MEENNTYRVNFIAKNFELRVPAIIIGIIPRLRILMELSELTYFGKKTCKIKGARTNMRIVIITERAIPYTLSLFLLLPLDSSGIRY